MSIKKNYLTISQNGSNEIIIKKSKFIANLAQTKTVDEANNFINQISKKYKDANHNTYAYVIGPDNQQVKASDNGEPSGTAGVPELKALELMQLRNVTAVVTRYFGGIKLGAGGLIRAYSNSITQAAQEIGVVKRILQEESIFTVPYHQLDKVNYFLKEKNIFIDHINYGVDVEFHVYTNVDQKLSLQMDLDNLLSAKIILKKGKQKYHNVAVTAHDYHNQ